MRVYVSGRIKDYEDFADHFADGCDDVRALGHEPVSPLDVDAGEEPTYADFMREDIRLMLDCGGIYMLRGWEESAGARCEHHVACMIGLDIMYEGRP